MLFQADMLNLYHSFCLFYKDIRCKQNNGANKEVTFRKTKIERAPHSSALSPHYACSIWFESIQSFQRAILKDLQQQQQRLETRNFKSTILEMLIFLVRCLERLHYFSQLFVTKDITLDACFFYFVLYFCYPVSLENRIILTTNINVILIISSDYS